MDFEYEKFLQASKAKGTRTDEEPFYDFASPMRNPKSPRNSPVDRRLDDIQKDFSCKEVTLLHDETAYTLSRMLTVFLQKWSTSDYWKVSRQRRGPPYHHHHLLGQNEEGHIQGTQ